MKSQQQKFPNRSVTFDDVVKMKPISSCKHDTMTQRSLKYYTSQDFKKVRGEMVMDIAKFRHGFPEDNTSLTYRGIEHMASSRAYRKSQSRHQAHIDAVLSEQLRQRTESRDCASEDIALDEMLLARISGNSSIHDAYVAIKNARKDAVDAIHFFRLSDKYSD